MCCCHRQNRCCCGCSNQGNGGAVTLPALDQLIGLANSGNTAVTRWPVYVSVPAFLWEEEERPGSCGCCRG